MVAGAADHQRAKRRMLSAARGEVNGMAVVVEPAQT
jgi:hypothetical protein